MHVRCWLTTGIVAMATLLLPFGLAQADMSESDLKEAIVLRCHYQMGEFGVAAVQHCVEVENAAMKSVSGYPQQAKEIVFRCTQRVQGDGWEVARACIDKDIEAEAALGNYPMEHTAVIESCRAQMGERGPAQVKACVDQRISTQSPAERP